MRETFYFPMLKYDAGKLGKHSHLDISYLLHNRRLLEICG
jgi:hypothetical protein